MFLPRIDAHNCLIYQISLIFLYSDLREDRIQRTTNGKIGENGVIVLEIVEVLESDQDIEFAFHLYLEAMNALHS